jgi:hypothetical protein
LTTAKAKIEILALAPRLSDFSSEHAKITTTLTNDDDVDGKHKIPKKLDIISFGTRTSGGVPRRFLHRINFILQP